MRFRKVLLSLYDYPKRGCGEVGVGLFSHVTSDRMSRNGLWLQQGMFTLDNGNDFFPERIVNPWNRLPKDLAAYSFLEVFKRHIDVVLKDLI